MEKLIVFGHKNPDTDSICSSLVMANLQTKLRGEEVTPCRLGEINEETKYALEHFGVEAPKLIEKVEEGQTVILVDHNEFSQSVEGIENAKIGKKVVDGKLTLIENKNDKSLIKLNIINRDFEELNIQLKKDGTQIFNKINPVEEEEIDYNLIQFIKYVSKNKVVEFTCTEIIDKANLQTTPKRFGRLLNSNLSLLEKEGVHIEYKKTSDKRSYIAKYEEPINEND